MARINIDDSIYSDYRFMKLVRELDSPDAALGALVRAWALAQKWYLTPEKTIPKKEWDNAEIPDAVLRVGLAEIIDGKVRVKGSEKQFSWLSQRSQAGKKGGAARRMKSLDNSPNGTNRSFNGREPPSSFLLSLNTNTNTKTKKEYSVGHESVKTLPAEVQNPVGFFIGRYVTAYKSLYGPKARPSLHGKAQGQIKRFVAETPIERACELIQVYLQMDDAWFKTKCHDFTTFLENLNKIGVALDTGEIPGKTKTYDYSFLNEVPTQEVIA